MLLRSASCEALEACMPQTATRARAATAPSRTEGFPIALYSAWAGRGSCTCMRHWTVSTYCY